MDNKQKEEPGYEKGEKLKRKIQWIFDICTISLLLFYLIHIQFGVGMNKINIEVKTDCQGKIMDIKGLPTNTTFNFTNVQKEIYKQIQTRGTT